MILIAIVPLHFRMVRVKCNFQPAWGILKTIIQCSIYNNENLYNSYFYDHNSGITCDFNPLPLPTLIEMQAWDAYLTEICTNLGPSLY